MKVQGLFREQTVFYLTTIILALIFIIEPIPSGTNGELDLWGTELRSNCVFEGYIGFECAGCGVTRSLVFAGRLDWSQAWHFNPAGIFLFAALCLTWLRTAMICLGREPRLQPLKYYMGVLLLSQAILIGSWLVRII